jgi:hypothetical protein
LRFRSEGGSAALAPWRLPAIVEAHRDHDGSPFLCGRRWLVVPSLVFDIAAAPEPLAADQAREKPL